MVYYGPWIDPPLIEETVTIGTAGPSPADRSIGRTVTPGASTSGITLAWSRAKAVAFKGNVADATPSPTYPRAVWDSDLPSELLDKAADFEIGGLEGDPEAQHLVASYVRHTGSHGAVGPTFDTYSQNDEWHWGATFWMLAQESATPFYLPPDRPAGATMAEFEEYGQPAELVSIAVDPPSLTSDAAHWSLRVLPGGDSSTSLRNAPYETVAQERALAAADGGYSLSATELAAMQDAMRPAGTPPAADDGRRVELALIYVGPYPGDLPGAPTIAGPFGHNFAYAGDAALALRVAYRVPRYRWVYDEPPVVPYRRVFPRDDGLAGGAPRTYPRPKSQQSSNRIVGAIF